MPTRLSGHRWYDSVLAWYFVSAWGSGFLAIKIGLLHAAPFTFLTPIFAVVLELALFGVAPTGLSIAGILITCLGVAMVSWRTPA